MDTEEDEEMKKPEKDTEEDEEMKQHESRPGK